MNNPPFLNLTPHDVNLLDGRVIRASGLSARCAQTRVKAGEHDGVALSRVTFGQIEVIDNATKEVVRVGLPEPLEGVVIIVSGLVRVAVLGRLDIASPGELVRDKEGKVVGCDGLSVN